jgi:hypothetical protein
MTSQVLRLVPSKFKANDKFLRGPIYNGDKFLGYEEEWKIMKIENGNIFFENDIIWKLNTLSQTSLYDIKRNK